MEKYKFRHKRDGFCITFFASNFDEAMLKLKNAVYSVRSFVYEKD